jgi:hypothetical protein
MPTTTLACKCKFKRCQSFSSADLGEVIEHLRRDHEPSEIKRPHALGVSDSHGHVWYCFGCATRYSKDHKSFDSDHAMWSHLGRYHTNWLENIIPEDEKADQDWGLS